MALTNTNQQNSNVPWWAQFGAGAGDLISNTLMPNPGDAASDIYNQAMETIPGFYQPWMNAGKEGLPQWQEQIKLLTQNPGQFINNIGKNYQQSPGYQFSYNQAMQSGNNAASAGGMAGSAQNQYLNQKTATNLANQDFYNYLKPALEEYNLGFNGLHDLSEEGLTASTSLGSDIGNILNNLAQLKYASQSNQNQGTGGGLGALISAGLQWLGG